MIISSILSQFFLGHVVKFSLAGFVSPATSLAFDCFPLHECKDSFSKGVDFLQFGQERGICSNSQTYLWLLEGCFNSGSFLDAQKLHSLILKLGFDRELEFCNGLVDAYLAGGDLNNAVKVLEDMPSRNVSTWNKIIDEFLAKKWTGKVLGLFHQMIAVNVCRDQNTFAGVLRACGGGRVGSNYIEQMHANITCHGFSTSSMLCNLLIDLYFRKGLVDSARKVFDRLHLKGSVSWVAMISGLSQNGCEREAILLFCQMLLSGIPPTPYVFSSALSACTKVELFDTGEQLHCLIHKGGFSSETYVCNALVTLYARSGNLISAEHIFSTTWNRDEVSYNSLISSLGQCGLSGRALDLFKKMQLDLLKPDCVTIASLLSSCASVGTLNKGKQLHSYAIKAGMSMDIILEGSLLDLYVKCSDVETAHEFFLTTNKENVVLWNVMLVAYGLLDNLCESFSIFKQMQIKGIIPNQFTYPNILRTCTSTGALDLGEQIHTQVIKTGFQLNVYVCSVLIDMYAKHGKLDTALGILSRLTEHDVVAWTAMVAGYTQHDLFVEALRIFEEMQYRGIQSDNIGFASAINACTGIQALKQGRQIHAQSCVFGYSDDLSIGNALVNLYARCGRVQEANLAFAKIDVKDNISWNGLISGFAQSGYCEEALQVYSQMNKAGLEINLFTFGSAVSAAANLANLKQGKQIHAMIIKTGYNSEVEVSNALITLYAKCGSINDAKRKFVEMPEKNEVSWNAMITGYSQHGCGVEALDLFNQMKQLGLRPSYVTFVGVLTACSHVGLVNEGLDYFESMTNKHGIIPKPEHYACVVDLLGRAGQLSHAKKFIEEMSIRPDAMVWRTLLSACRVHKNLEIGRFAASHLLELEPEDSATYVLLSNMYAMTGKWDWRDHTRQLMKERGVKKEPGRSWIEVNNSIHAFFAGDRIHPYADKLYKFLEDLDQRAAEIGYIKEHYHLLNSLEQDQKDQKVYVHSEKLAIAFGLLSLTDSIPIHVIKNLRICNDCHNWIKYVSKISNRAMVVRDAYRFHHFEGGFCSCRDYW